MSLMSPPMMDLFIQPGLQTDHAGGWSPTRRQHLISESVLFLTHTHTLRDCSCVLLRPECAWSSDSRCLIPLMWGNIAGVGPQRPLGWLEVQTVLFSGRDLPLKFWSSTQTFASDRRTHPLFQLVVSSALFSLTAVRFLARVWACAEIRA